MFGISWLGLFFAVSIAFCFLLVSKKGPYFKKPSLGYSDLTFFTRKKFLFKNLQMAFFWIAFSLFLCALISPFRWVESQVGPQKKLPKAPTEGIAIYLLLDKSGSMAAEITTELPNGQKKTLSKMDLLKEVTKAFILGSSEANLKGRPQDLIGVIAFARSASDLSPLTLDRKRLIEKIDAMQVVDDPSLDGTSIGYAIYKGASLINATQAFAKKTQAIESAYEIKSTVMILITDGFQDPSRLDWTNPLRTIDPIYAANYVKKSGIRLYIINLEPRYLDVDAAPLRHVMEKAAEMTGGRFFLVNEGQSLSQIYASIDLLEKSLTEESPNGETIILEKKLYYAFFLGLGMCFLAAFIFIKTLIVRELP